VDVGAGKAAVVDRHSVTLEPGRYAGPRVLETVGKGYRLAVDPDAVDAIRFERLPLTVPSVPAKVLPAAKSDVAQAHVWPTHSSVRGD
jgi:hypothetical protein